MANKRIDDFADGGNIQTGDLFLISRGGTNYAVSGSKIASAGSSGSVTSVALAGTGDFLVSGSPITSAGTLSIALSNTGVAAGTYSLAQVTVDSRGRVTAIANGSQNGGTVTSVALSSNSLTVANSPITSAGTISVNLSTVAGVSGSYQVPTLTVDSFGRVTSITNGVVNAGSVTSVGLAGPAADFTITNSPITSSGNLGIALRDTGVTAGTYTFAQIAVDSRGRITAAASGSAVTSVAISSSDLTVTGSPITSTGTIALTLGNSGVTAGSYSLAQITVDAKGRITAAANGVIPNSGVTAGSYQVPTLTVGVDGRITSISNGAVNAGSVTSVGITGSEFAISNSPITSAGNIGLALANTGVVAGSFTLATVTVDAKGRVMSIASGNAVTSVGITGSDFSVSNSPVTSSGNIALALANSGAQAGTYTLATVTVDAKGRVTSAVNGSVPNTTVSPGTYQVPTITVGADGRITSASNGAVNAGSVTSVGLSGPSGDFTIANTPVTSAGTITIALSNTGITPGTYSLGAMDSVSIDARGRITASVGGLTTPHKAWRLRIDNTYNTSYCSLAELQFRTAVGTGRLATGGTAFSTSTGNSTTPGDAFDGNAQSRWVAAYPDTPYPKYLGYIYATPINVVEILIQASNGYQTEVPIAGAVEWSDDTTTGLDGTWSQISTFSSPSAWAASESRVFPVGLRSFQTVAYTGSYSDLKNTGTGVAAGSYTSANITVGADGRITTVANGAVPNTAVSPGSYSLANITVGQDGRLTYAANGAVPNTTVSPGTYQVPTITIGPDGRITSASNGAVNAGSVTSVGLTGPSTDFLISNSPITSAGNISLSLANVQASPGTYTLATVTVDAKGRVTSVSSGTAGTVTSVNLFSNTLTVSGVVTTAGSLTVNLPNTAVTPGQYTVPTIQVDQYGRVTSISNGINAGTVTSVGLSGPSGDFTITNTPITSTGNLGIALATTGVSAGTYSVPTVTVDAKGRVTSITNGAVNAGSVTSVGITGSDFLIANSPITSSGNISLALAASGVTPGTYTVSTVTVDAKGRVTTIANGVDQTSNVSILQGQVSGLINTGSHKSWRLRVIKMAGSDQTQVSLDGLEFRTQAGVSVKPSGGTVIYSSTSSRGSPAQAFDNNHSSSYPGWYSQNPASVGNEYIGYTYASAITVAEIALQRSNENYPSEFYIEYSDDGQNWYPAIHPTNVVINSFSDVATFPVPGGLLSNVAVLQTQVANLGANSGVTAGTYTNATITVDARGRVTNASSGSTSNAVVTTATNPGLIPATLDVSATVSKPVISDFTFTDASTSVLSNGTYGITYFTTTTINSPTTSFATLLRPVQTTSGAATFVVGFSATFLPNAYNSAGIIVQDSSGKFTTLEVIYNDSGFNLEMNNWSSPTKYSSTVVGTNKTAYVQTMGFNNRYWMKIQYDPNAPLTSVFVSPDGVSWQPFSTTNFIAAPTMAGFGFKANDQSSSTTFMKGTFFHYSETAGLK